jgi:SAM-dependent methyltransferase
MARDADRAVALQRKYYTETAAQYEEMHQHEGTGDPREMDFIVAMLRMLQVRTMLDVGTASGRVLVTLKSAIPELVLCGVEPVGALLDQAVVRGNTKCGSVVQGKGDALPFADASFDAVCEFAILHHVADPGTVVSEMLRVAKRAVFLSDSNRFGQGSLPARLLKLALYKIGLWGTFNYLSTFGKGYQVTEGDGVSYSYSVYDSYDQISRWADRIILVPADKTRAKSWLHPLLTSSGIILCGIRDEARAGAR